MPLPNILRRFLPDTFTVALVITVVLSSVFPCYGYGARVFESITNIAIALLFFFHGAKLSRQAVVAGMTHWRLHGVVFLFTFVAFPLLGLLLKPLLDHFLTPELYLGVLFLCTLPSTVQSSSAFTSMARGNVPAAICSASASNLIGIFLTPLLVGLLLAQQGGPGFSFDALGSILLQLFLPFVAGQVARRWIGSWVDAHRGLLRVTDQSSILLVVYTAFSAAVIGGLWQQTPLSALLALVLSSAFLLALVISLTTYGSRKMGFNKEDEIAIVFCGSKKSLASGVPIANVLFSAYALGAIVLPLMIFHQIQLMVCAVLAQRYAKRPEENARKQNA